MKTSLLLASMRDSLNSLTVKQLKVCFHRINCHFLEDSSFLFFECIGIAKCKLIALLDIIENTKDIF